MRRNIKAEKRKQQRIAYKEARDNCVRLPHGGRVNRARYVQGELNYRKIVCRSINRRDRRKANMQLREAKFNHNVDAIGRPFVNLIDASRYITS